MVSKTKDGKSVWSNSYNSKSVSILKGRGARHTVEIIAALSLLGPSTTREIAKFVLSNSPSYEYKPVHDKDASSLERRYYRRIYERSAKGPGKKKLPRKYPGLIKKGYVDKTKKNLNTKNREVPDYYLTLKGCFFALGFHFNDMELTSFLDNAAKNHLYFAYISKVMHETSLFFVKMIFVHPLQRLIERGRIVLDEDFTFYFSNIVESHGRELIDIIKEIIQTEQRGGKFRLDKNRYFVQIQKLLKCTFYDKSPTSNWFDAMEEYFYPQDEDRDFFIDYSDKGIESNLLYRTMEAIHFGYFRGLESNVPQRTQKIPVSKSFKEHRRYYPEYKSPRDYDRKKRIIIR